MLVRRGTSKRSVISQNPSNSTTFIFTHADVLALHVEYHAPTTWYSLKANSRRRETIHFRLTSDGVQPAYGAFHIDVVDAGTTMRSIQDGDDDHVTENRSTLIAAAVTSGLAVTAAIFAVVGVICTVFYKRRSIWPSRKQPSSQKVPTVDKKQEDEVQLPEVVLVSVSNLPPSDARPPAGIVREPIRVDWSNVDPEILQHCRTTDPILHSEKVWV